MYVKHSLQVGFLTTFAILLHEIPHEVRNRRFHFSECKPCCRLLSHFICDCCHPQVGDFAILLRAGFDRWSAARMQMSTALVGVLGACFALCTQSPKGTGEILRK